MNTLKHGRMGATSHLSVRGPNIEDHGLNKHIHLERRMDAVMAFAIVPAINLLLQQKFPHSSNVRQAGPPGQKLCKIPFAAI